MTTGQAGGFLYIHNKKPTCIHKSVSMELMTGFEPVTSSALYVLK